MNYNKESLKLHEMLGGKLEVCSKIKLDSRKNLSLVYTPGVGEVCKEIANNKSEVYKYTIKKNCVAVISDGSSVLGLGNLGSRQQSR